MIKSSPIKDRNLVLGYSAAIVAAGISTVVRWSLGPWLGPLGVFSLYYPAVVAVAVYGGLGPGIVATLLSGLAAVMFFAISLPSSAEIFLLIEFVFTGTIISLLSEALYRSRKRVAIELEQAHVREALAALRDSEARAKVVLDSAVDGIITIDERGIVDSMNPAAERLFGYQAEEVIGKNVSMLMPNPYRDQHDRYIANYTMTGQRKIIGIGREVVGLRKDGSTFPMYLGVNEMWIGGRRMFTGLVHDLTSQKRTEDNLRVAKEAAELAHREADAANRTKDEFLATISHELRTPLNAMLGWARLLRMGGMDKEGADQAVEAIERNALTQAQLIEDLLDVSRIVSGKLRLDLKPVGLEEVIAAAIASVQPAAQAKEIHLNVSIDEPAAKIRADPTRMQQVVWNLLSNAIKFTPFGGQVQISVRHDPSQVQLVVSDTGKGIALEFLPHVFERFRQADGSSTRTHSGLGLGLAIVRHIVEMHGGTVDAASAGLGQGAMFTVRLPVNAAESKDMNQPAATTK